GTSAPLVEHHTRPVHPTHTDSPTRRRVPGMQAAKRNLVSVAVSASCRGGWPNTCRSGGRRRTSSVPDASRLADRPRDQACNPLYFMVESLKLATRLFFRFN